MTPRTIVDKLLETDTFDAREYLNQGGTAEWSCTVERQPKGYAVLIRWNGQTVGREWVRSAGGANKVAARWVEQLKKADAVSRFDPKVDGLDAVGWYLDVAKRHQYAL